MSNDLQVTPIPTRELWEKMPDETPRAFTAFLTYRDLPASSRSIKNAVIKLHGPENVTLSKLSQFGKWSAKYRWVLRASSWDEQLDKTRRIKILEDVLTMNDRHRQIGMKLQGLAITRLNTLKAEDLELSDILRFIEAGTKVERIALGQPTDISANKNLNINLNEIPDFASMDDDKLREYLAKEELTNPEVIDVKAKKIG